MEMPKDTHLVVLFSFLNLSGLFLVVYCGGFASEFLDIVAKPLPATEILICVVCSCNLIQGVCSQTLLQNKIKMFSIAKSIFALISGVVLFYTIAVIYGAPVTESIAETAHLALLLTTTSVLPCCLVLGSKIDTWLRVFAENSPEYGVESVVQITTICSVVGAWLGAFPIPLDWDRPWQEWPISCVLGTAAGYGVGLLLGILRLSYQYRRTQKMKLV